MPKTKNSVKFKKFKVNNMIGNEKAEYSANGLKSLIDSYEAISFDMFDTLVMRTVYFNQDVFRIVAEKYKDQVPDFFVERVNAEKALTLNGYPYIEQIYDRIAQKCRIETGLAAEIMNFEVELERSVIVVRRAVVDIFDYCKSAGKKVYIVSDMYIHKRELEDIINKAGVCGYEKMFVSCEYGSGKLQCLFERYKNEVRANSYLHIGDSFPCDIAASAKFGINSFRVKTATEIWESMGGTPSSVLEERNKQARRISLKFNDPFYDAPAENFMTIALN